MGMVLWVILTIQAHRSFRCVRIRVTDPRLEAGGVHCPSLGFEDTSSHVLPTVSQPFIHSFSHALKSCSCSDLLKPLPLSLEKCLAS